LDFAGGLDPVQTATNVPLRLSSGRRPTASTSSYGCGAEALQDRLAATTQPSTEQRPTTDTVRLRAPAPRPGNADHLASSLLGFLLGLQVASLPMLFYELAFDKTKYGYCCQDQYGVSHQDTMNTHASQLGGRKSSQNQSPLITSTLIRTGYLLEMATGTYPPIPRPHTRTRLVKIHPLRYPHSVTKNPRTSTRTGKFTRWVTHTRENNTYTNSIVNIK
jgi:hypothetical protein